MIILTNQLTNLTSHVYLHFSRKGLSMQDCNRQSIFKSFNQLINFDADKSFAPYLPKAGTTNNRSRHLAKEQLYYETGNQLTTNN